VYDEKDGVDGIPVTYWSLSIDMIELLIIENLVLFPFKIAGVNLLLSFKICIPD
jgi:hypothetical protein